MASLPLKVQAKACLDAVTTLYDLEGRKALPTPVERQRLAAFPGFGLLALDLFPHALTGQYKDRAWEEMGTHLKQHLAPEDYASAARATYTQFWTPRLIMRALFLGLKHCGVPDDATVFEPGCGVGRFMGVAGATMHFLAVEQDLISGRICRTLYPQHDIRLAPIQHTHLDPSSVDAVIGNIPFSQEKTAYWGRKLSLHELCIAKSLDALRPGGILALVVTHYLLDRQSDTFRRTLSAQSVFLGAMRLPSLTFAAEGTRVVTDLLFLQKRDTKRPGDHDEEWLHTDVVPLPNDPEQTPVPLNRYFLQHPGQVLGTLVHQDRLYGKADGYSVVGTGQLAAELARALSTLPRKVFAAFQPGAWSPPPLTHTAAHAEGTLFILEGQICQRSLGQDVPLSRGGSPILVSGTLGTRIAHLIRLRDERAEVVQLQRLGAPQSARDAARAQLQQTYLAFLRAYGAINTVSVSVRADGKAVRRLPNLAVFRDDPAAVQVMALEAYNETTGLASPEAILFQDVVGHDEPITAVESADEGLLVVLNQTGRVDVGAIAALYGQPIEAVVSELGDLLYHDPATSQWETADVYLSGHVKRKLAQARGAATSDPAYTRNVEALAAVQPPDLLPSEIDAGLGAPWIPVDILEDFARKAFQTLYRSDIRVKHQPTLALWSVDAGQRVSLSTFARVTYGTQRVSGVTLFQQALNLQTPIVHDTVTDAHGKEHQVVNQGETLVAQEKQAALKQAFKAWLWQDDARSARCVRLYNDLHNTHRGREVCGDHLTFPGMTPLITLTAAQKAAVWQMLTMGNTYLGHATGSGKTYAMLAAGMKMKQAGLIRKPLYVVKNNTLEQFGRMALTLYPQARFLLAESEDFGKESRKLMAAKMASAVWDGIITTHTALSHLAISATLQRSMLETLVSEYEALLVDHQREHGRVEHTIRKALERQKNVYKTRLADLLKASPKDDGLCFDELGIDYFFLDEAHFSKNLETPTKMKYVAGVTSEGSARALDVFLKTQVLHRLRPGHGITFASATPVTNTMGELYTIQKYLTPQALEESGIAHFDAWAATFGDVVTEMELGPDGQTLRPRSRFAHFTNLPDLQQMLRQFMTYKTADQLALPVPALAGGKAEPVLCPMSPTQRQQQADLVRRYERVRSGQAGRWSGEPVKILGDGKKMAVDARLLDAQAGDWPFSKLHALCERVVAHWQEGKADRTTQLLFCDLGVKPTAWGFSFYEAVLDTLVKRGIPQHEVARIDQATNPQARLRLCTQVQQGEVRVLMGSTEKLGTGTNVQERLVAVHHLDVPYRPSDIEQREGRLLRQGNLHRDWGKPVHIYVYGTEGSVEAMVWQGLERKAHFLHQFLSGATTTRTAEDVGEQELTYAQLKALVSGNPALRVLAETDGELRRLALLEKHHRDARFSAQRRLKSLPEDRDRQTKYLVQCQTDALALARWDALPLSGAHGEPCPGAPYGGALTIQGQLAPSAHVRLRDQEAIPLLDRVLESSLVTTRLRTQTLFVGMYKGMRCGISTSQWMGAEVWLEGQLTRRVPLARRTRPGVAFLSALHDLVADIPVRVAQAQHHLEEALQEGRTAEALASEPFALAFYQQALVALRTLLEGTMSEGGDVSAAEGIAQAIAELRATHQGQAQPGGARSEGQTLSLADSVIPRLLEARPGRGL